MNLIERLVRNHEAELNSDGNEITINNISKSNNDITVILGERDGAPGRAKVTRRDARIRPHGTQRNADNIAATNRIRRN